VAWFSGRFFHNWGLCDLFQVMHH